VRKSKPGIYKALGTDGFELCHPVNKEDYERINVEIGGASRQANWNRLPVQLIHQDDGKVLAVSDSPWLGYGPLIFRPVVVEALSSLRREYGVRDKDGIAAGRAVAELAAGTCSRLPVRRQIW
jgi:hypothetical protein